jgi:hypothetical protein
MWWKWGNGRPEQMAALLLLLYSFARGSSSPELVNIQLSSIQ